MRLKITATCFLPFTLLCNCLPVSGQSQVAKADDRGTTQNEVFHVGGDVTAPIPVYRPDPEFSETARKAAYQGTCALSLIVGSDGLPRNIRVARDPGMGLAEQATRAVRQWRFEPARKGGKPVAVAMEVEVTFHLDRNGARKVTLSAEQYEQERDTRLRALSQIYRIPGGREPISCPVSSTERQNAVTVADLLFEGDLQMPSLDRALIADSVKKDRYVGSEEEVATEISARVQRAWQNSGYFTAQIHTDTSLLTSGPRSQRIAATVHIEEGQQYRLERIQFENNRAIRSAYLRTLFQIKDGDIFNHEAIEKGVGDLRRAYGEYGYADLSSVLTTHVHEDRQAISLDIDLKEGKQFYISRIDVLGLDQASFEKVRPELLLIPGDIYNQRLMELTLERLGSPSLAQSSFKPRYELHMDRAAGTLAMTYDFQRCGAE